MTGIVGGKHVVKIKDFMSIESDFSPVLRLRDNCQNRGYSKRDKVFQDKYPKLEKGSFVQFVGLVYVDQRQYVRIQAGSGQHYEVLESLVENTQLKLSSIVQMPSVGSLEYQLTMQSQGQIMYERPGVLIYDSAPTGKSGDLIYFKLQDRVIHVAKILTLEPPGSSIRPDCPTHKWKLHWWPLSTEELFKIQELQNPIECPSGCKGRTSVIDSRGTIRTRKCVKCGIRWLTKEYFEQTIRSRR